MKPRAKDPIGSGGPSTPSWMAGIVIGMTITALATSAMMLGAGMAMGQAINRPK